jgi:hypothetical protein
MARGKVEEAQHGAPPPASPNGHSREHRTAAIGVHGSEIYIYLVCAMPTLSIQEKERPLNYQTNPHGRPDRGAPTLSGQARGTFSFQLYGPQLLYILHGGYLSKTLQNPNVHFLHETTPK